MSELPIRILNLFTILNRGGAESMCMNLYRNIDRSKVQFDFLVHRQERGLFEDEIEALGGRVYRLSPIYPRNFVKYKAELRHFFEEHREYEILHSHMSELGYFAFKVAKKRGVPYCICHAHGAPRGFDIKMIARNYFKYMMQPYLTHRFACGEEAGKWLFPNKPFNVLNNAIDAERFRFSAEVREQMRRELGLEDALVVGTVGNIAPVKNPFGMLDIFQAVHEKRPDAKLLWVGNKGQLIGELEKKISEYGLDQAVILTGVRMDIARLLQAMDAFVLPSLWEGLPVVTIEAQAAGLRCFISDTVTQECDVTGRCGFLPLDQPERWAAEILAADLNHADTKQQIIDAGYDIHTTAKWLEDFYLNLAKDRS